MKILPLAFVLYFSSVFTSIAQPQVKLVELPDEQKVNVLIDGKFFTSYLYLDVINKPILWPVMTSGGNEVTRRFPLKIKAGERADHPHQVGLWFNYGNVNGIDFWNNSKAVPADKADQYGTITHQSIGSVKSGKGQGVLVTTSAWKDNSGKVLLDEVSEYIFTVKGNTRIIDRYVVLRANDGRATFTDNKEGMFGIRVARELELPSNGSIALTDSYGNVTEVDASDDGPVTGSYLSSEGITGNEVWGTRARWMKLAGDINGEKVALVIFDHPSNPGFPTYWHARGYGLFAANPLGQKVFSEGKEELNFEIQQGKTASFVYRVAVFSEDPSIKEIEAMASDFVRVQ